MGVALARAVECATLAREDLLDAQRGPLGNLCDLLGGGLSQGVEHERASRIFAGVDAVQSDDVDVDVEPQRRVSALNDAHGSGERLLQRTQVERALRAVLQRAGLRGVRIGERARRVEAWC